VEGQLRLAQFSKIILFTRSAYRHRSVDR